MHLSLNPISWWPLILIAGIAAMGYVLWLYRSALGGQEGRWKVLVVVLRAAALIMLLAATLRPALVFTENREQPASLIFLYDKSRSMMVGDAWDGQTRWEALNQIMRQSSGSLEDIAEVLSVREFCFDGTPVENRLSIEQPDGRKTAIGDSLREVLRNVSGRIAGIVLLSDGANTVTAGAPPLNVARSLRDRAIPLYSVGFGQESAIESSRDMALQSIDAGPIIFEKNKLLARSDLDVRGFGGQKVSVRLLMDQIEVDRNTIDIPRRDGTQRIELGSVPKTPGEHKVTVQVAEMEPKKGELVITNNSISTFVTVLKGGIRVLYLDGGFGSWEQAFLRIALDKSPDIQVDFLALRGPVGEADALRLVEEVPFDALLIRDIPRSWLPDAAMLRIKEKVEAGAGFAMLGGRRSFGPGGFAESAIADLLPVTVHPADLQIEDTGEQPVQLVPTAQGREYLLRLSDDTPSTEIWSGMAPLLGGSTFASINPRALVFATSPKRTPLLVGQDFGRGRSMAVAGDSTWQWYRQKDTRLHHRRFWRQLILWLTHKENAGDENVWVKLAKRRIASGEGLEVIAGADDENGSPMKDVDFKATITAPDGSEFEIRLIPQGDEASGTFWNTEQDGDYSVRVSAAKDNSEIGRAPVRKFLTYQDDMELAMPAADLELLRQMAQTTNGEYVEPEELPDFLSDLSSRDLNLNVERLSYVRLWDNWFFLLLFVGLMTTEWAIRKWRGLV